MKAFDTGVQSYATNFCQHGGDIIWNVYAIILGMNELISPTPAGMFLIPLICLERTSAGQASLIEARFWGEIVRLPGRLE